MSLARQRLTAQEYLLIERAAECKSEFFQGRMYSIAGANRRHNLIVTNVTRELGIQFKGRSCEVYSQDMRVKVSATGLYTYPDIVALCAVARFEDEKEETLLNPALVIEVLSSSTESYDRGGKFAHYRRVDSITDYVLVSQDRMRVEHYSRQPEGRWLLTEVSDVEESLEIANLRCRLPLAEIYDKVELEPAGHP